MANFVVSEPGAGMAGTAGDFLRLLEALCARGRHAAAW